MPEPTIDPEFKSLLPALEPDEYNKLADSLRAEGCRDPILTWRNLVIDGHNRIEICWAESIPFETREMKFDSRDAVMIWMMMTQLGRRNLGTVDRARIAVKLKEKLQKTPRKDGVVNLPPRRSREIAAKNAHVSGRTVEQMEKVVNSSDKTLNAMVDSGDVGIAAAASVASLPTPQRKAIVAAGPAAVKAKAKEIREHTAPAPGKLDHLPEEIRPVFEEAGVFAEMLNHLTQLSKLYNQASGGNIEKDKGKPMACGTALAKDYQRGARMIQELRAFISGREPENICVYCRGENPKRKTCKPCMGGGWSTAFQWRTSTKEQRENAGWNK